MDDNDVNNVQINPSLVKKPRNTSFELLRILCMLLIVSSHFLGHGKWIDNMQGVNLVLGHILQSVFRPAVNLFVMISAYFLSTSKSTDVNWKKIGKLYLQVYVYSAVLYVSTLVSGDYQFSSTTLLQTIFPVITGKYWFFTSYIIMMLASPYINVLLRHITVRQHFGICVFFAIAGSLSAGFHTFDLFPLNTGYNSIWFIGLYFIASLIRRTDFTLVGKQKPIALVIYLIAVVVGAITIIGIRPLSHSRIR